MTSTTALPPRAGPKIGPFPASVVSGHRRHNPPYGRVAVIRLARRRPSDFGGEGRIPWVRRRSLSREVRERRERGGGRSDPSGARAPSR